MTATGLSSEFNDRWELSNLSLSEVGKLSGGALLVYLSPSQIYEEGRTKFDPAHPANDVLVTNIEKKWALTAEVSEWRASPASSPRVLIGLYGTPNRGFILGSLLIDVDGWGDEDLAQGGGRWRVPLVSRTELDAEGLRGRRVSGANFSNFSQGLHIWVGGDGRRKHSGDSLPGSANKAFAAKGKRQFGEIPGIPIGSSWSDRRSAAHAGVHRPTIGGISGTRAEGADSICVNGGYEDDLDFGEEIIFTGAGGNDPGTKRQIADQELSQPGIAGLVTSQQRGLPVRVLRGSQGNPTYSPSIGFRYDGLHRVSDHWSERGKRGFRVWRFQLLQLASEEAGSYPSNPLGPVGNPIPGTTSGVTVRIIRSTPVAEHVKGRYDFQCQVCGEALAVPGGFVAEAAHIRGLGRPHAGPDVTSNVLCLCPNHHSLFDQGGIYITDSFEVRDHLGTKIGGLILKHEVDRAQLAYHRELWNY